VLSALSESCHVRVLYTVANLTSEIYSLGLESATFLCFCLNLCNLSLFVYFLQRFFCFCRHLHLVSESNRLKTKTTTRMNECFCNGDDVLWTVCVPVQLGYNGRATSPLPAQTQVQAKAMARAQAQAQAQTNKKPALPMQPEGANPRVPISTTPLSWNLHSLSCRLWLPSLAIQGTPSSRRGPSVVLLNSCCSACFLS
jgi:hypothetical protein